MTFVETTYFNSQKVYLTVLNHEEFEKISQPIVTSVHCFPIQDNSLLFTKNPRGLDIIGGHVEPGESIYDCLYRESFEEASITLKTAHIIGAIQIDNRDNSIALEKGYPLIGFQVFFMTDNFHMNEFKPTHECTDRVFISQDNIKTSHHHWLNSHEQLCSMAFEQHLINQSLKTKKSHPKM